MLRSRAVMVCGVKQHTGKTSLSLALLNSLHRQLPGRVGYMKPVGQQWVEVETQHGRMRVDKDAAVARHYFGLDNVCASCLSPIVIDKGFTKSFLDGTAQQTDSFFARRLKESFQTITAANDFVVVEGTGHCGVGSVLGWSNARVAATLGVDVVLVANGGIGSTFDDLALNMAACRAEGANVAGVVINRCMAHKVDEVKSYLQRALNYFGQGVPVLAVVPDADELSLPSVSDLQHLLASDGGVSGQLDRSSAAAATAADDVLLSGCSAQRHERFLHYEHGCTGPEGAPSELEQSASESLPSAAGGDGNSRVCFVADVTRHAHIARVASSRTAAAGLIIAGGREHALPPRLEELVHRARIPVLRSHMDVCQTIETIKSFTPKMHADDQLRTRSVVEHYSPHLDDAASRMLDSLPPARRSMSGTSVASQLSCSLLPAHLRTPQQTAVSACLTRY